MIRQERNTIPPKQDVPPIFILGSPRSFTSLICAMLGQHPAAYGLPELNLFATDTLRELVERMSGYRQINLHGLLRVAAELSCGEQSLPAIDSAKRWVFRRLDRSTAEIYWEISEKIKPLRPIDKSPLYTLHMTSLLRIHEAYPDAYYIHLIRHPATQGRSIMNVAGGAMAILTNSIDYTTRPPTIDPQIQWFQVQRNILRFLEKIPEERKVRLRGEDILNDLRGQLSVLCERIGLPVYPAAIEAMMHPEDSPYAQLGPVGAHLGNDVNFLRSPQVRIGRIETGSLDGPLSWRSDGGGFKEAVKELARSFGYS